MQSCRRVLATLLFAVVSCAMARLEVNVSSLGHSVDKDTPYFHARVQVRNVGSGRMDYRIRVSPNYGQDSEIVLRGAPLQSGEERVHNLALPFTYQGNVMITDSLGSNYQNPLASSGNLGKLYLNISELERFASEKEQDDFTAAFISVGGRSGYYSHSGTPGSGDRIVSQVEPRDLPENWLCYTPYFAVFARQTAYDRMTGSEKAALLRYVDGGGQLCVYGSDRNTSEALGLGHIVYRPDSPVGSASLEREWVNPSAPWRKLFQSGTDSFFPYRVDKPGGRTGAFFIATMFLILAGPVNYFYYRRRNRIRMLIVSTPIISAGFCLLITAFFIGTEGFARKGGTVSLTTFDERSDRGWTFAQHSVYSGLYPLNGFQFPADTAFLPLKSPEDFTISIGPVQHLQDGLFQPTTNFGYCTMTPFQSRERLLWDAQQASVINGMEQPLEAVVVQDVDGTLYKGGRVAPNGRLTLTKLQPTEIPAEDGSGSPAMLRILKNLALSPQEAQTLDTRFSTFGAPVDGAKENVRYAALITQRVATTNPGLEIDGPRNCNVLLGIADTQTTGTR